MVMRNGKQSIGDQRWVALVKVQVAVAEHHRIHFTEIGHLVKAGELVTDRLSRRKLDRAFGTAELEGKPDDEKEGERLDVRGKCQPFQRAIRAQRRNAIPRS